MYVNGGQVEFSGCSFYDNTAACALLNLNNSLKRPKFGNLCLPLFTNLTGTAVLVRSSATHQRSAHCTAARAQEPEPAAVCTRLQSTALAHHVNLNPNPKSS